MLCSCISIKFLYEHMSMRWVLEHQLLFVKALLFVIMDLTGEVRSSSKIVFLLTALAREVMQSPSSVRLSVRPFVFTLSSELTDH